METKNSNGGKESNMVEQFLTHFYNTISFREIEEFKENDFLSLFLENASLLEENEGKFEKQTPIQYVRQFTMILKNNKEFFVNGFIEKQIEYEKIETENGYLVASRYEKSYANNEGKVVEYGTNQMILVEQNGQLKIASILW